MSKNKAVNGKKKISISSLAANNKVVFLFSLILAIVFWCILSMSETTETERVFQDIVVKINIDGSLPQKNELEIFGQSEFKVNVTVKGLSYIVNDKNFGNDDISVTASCSSVMEAGLHKLPLSVSINGNYSGNVEVVNISSSDINVSFDKRETKTFTLQEEIIELDGYKLGENVIRENPRLSSDSIVISGPSLVLSRINAVKARVELDSELTQKLSIPAEIVALTSSGEELDISDCTIEGETVNVYIPVKISSILKTDVKFTNVPEALREKITYSVAPETIEVKVDANSEVSDGKIFIGEIDFSQLSYGVNKIRIENSDLLTENPVFEVTVDFTGYVERWLSPVSISLDDIDVPSNITIKTTQIERVRVICTPAVQESITLNEIYFVPVFDKAEYQPGVYNVPAKFVFRNLKDCWVYTDYYVTIEVK